MITHMFIDGFKSFRELSLELAPFQVIVGANGVGKSNLFDSIRLLSLLTEQDLRSAFQALRGEAGELFSLQANGETVTTMRFRIDVFLQREIEDSWGANEELKHVRLRYELTIERRQDSYGLERLYVAHEALTTIKREEDTWANRYLGKQRAKWLLPLKTGRTQPFISTEQHNEMVTINLHQDGHGGRKSSVAERAERTMLSGVINTEFPHAFALREEMRTWKFLQLNPMILRQPSPTLGPLAMTAEGEYLASTLARMQSEDPTLLSDISRDLANLVPGIRQISVEHDQSRNRYIVWAEMNDRRRFSSRVLSDGTLRLLALVTLRHDPLQRGVLAFEEPENGVHPFRIKSMANLLREFATDFTASDEAERPLRQLIINTHSPVLVSHLVQLYGEHAGIIFAHMPTRISPNQYRERVSVMQPINPSNQIPICLLYTSPSPRD